MFSNRPRFALIAFFVLAYLFTWLRWVPVAAAAQGWINFTAPFGLELLAGYGPLLAALLIASLFGGRAALKDLAARLVRWRVAPRWYLVVFLLPVLLQGGKLLLLSLFSAEPLQVAENRLPIAEMLTFFPLLVLGFDGLGEEVGWRGFALPRLLEQHSPLVASLVLGILWGLWHLPYALTPGSALADTPLFLLLLNTAGLAILHTWIFHHARASIFIAILFHAWNNLVSIIVLNWLPATGTPLALALGQIVLWLLAIGVVLYMRPFHLARKPSQRQTQANPNQAA